MKNWNNIIALIFVLFIAVSCEESGDDPVINITETSNADPGSQEWIQANQAFSINLFQQLAKDEEKENVFISPLSIELALSMTANGAEGNTLQQMESLLGQEGFTIEAANLQFQSLLNNVPQTEDFQLNIANSIWYSDQFIVKDPFIQTNKDFYQAEVTALDFTAPSSVDEINNWVSEKTENTIPAIIDQIDPLDVMFLINAIYFKADWKNIFPSEFASSLFFQVGGDQAEPREFMGDERLYPYLETSDFQAISLLYTQEDYAMSIFLPKEGKSLSEWIQTVDATKLNQWMSSFQDQEVFYNMPKLEIDYSRQLNQTLQDLGMTDAFQPNLSNFAGINDRPDVYISKVQHKTFLNIHEEGTEASAATSIGVGTTSVGVPTGPISMVVDRPFALIIHQRSTGRIFFIGTIYNPLQES